MASVPEKAIEVNINPHQGQFELLQILEDPATKEVYVVAGRRWGKTFLMAVGASKFGLENPYSPHYVKLGTPNPPHTAIAIVGPDFPRAKRVWDEIGHLFADVIKKKTETDLKIVLRGGAQISVWSGENLASIRGAGYDLVILDEAVGLSEASVQADVMPTLADRSGRLWAISSPKYGRRNWFNKRYLEASAGLTEGVRGFHATSFDNPNIDGNDLRRQIARLDPLTVREEYYAEILDSSSSWLDPSLINIVTPDQVPPNTFNILVLDSAWGRPEVVERSTRRRKDATVIAVLAQDLLGNVYCIDGVWDQDLLSEQAFDIMDNFIRQYGCVRLVKERVADDMFSSAWFSYVQRHGTPLVGLVLPTRKKDWKAQQIRYWAGQVLYRGKFYMTNGCPLYQPLRDEMDSYNEADSARDKCADDCLTAMSDVLQKGAWMGGQEWLAAREDVRPVKDIFRLKNAMEGREIIPPSSRYSIV